MREERDGLHGLHISELDTVNVGLTMAHCYSDLSRLPAKVEQGGCEGGLEPPATGIQRVRGSRSFEDGYGASKMV